ncbi:MFS transporter [Aliivibrio kagoshimensis]|uniref:MFS transporter n=1 Tax=Aliivibrio kagoshimensis TaxID=2910230 RepID=UPI003D09B02F
MSLLSVPFVGTGSDLGLHFFAGAVLVSSIGAVLYAFWKFHEMPINKAHRTKHQQIGLITVLTWIGFIWHWVWVLAVILAFIDAESALCRIRDIWRRPSENLDDDKEIKEC